MVSGVTQAEESCSFQPTYSGHHHHVTVRAREDTLLVISSQGKWSVVVMMVKQLILRQVMILPVTFVIQLILELVMVPGVAHSSVKLFQPRIIYIGW